jgi:Protein of unknown function (DUF4238)
MPVPKRHHYVPQMILNGFTDAAGWLHWCRHREEPNLVRRGRPIELFHKKHLYSTLSGSGIKDPAMEHILAALENEAVSVVQAILEPTRSGKTPVLSDAQKRIWYLLFLMQWRRTPENQLSCTSDEEASRMIDEILDELRSVVPHREDEIAAYGTPESKARTIRNVRVQSLVGFNANVIGVLEHRGISIIRITRPNKQFIIGSRPVVKLTSPGRTDLNDLKVEMWLPIAADIAVGVGQGDGEITLFETENDTPIRQLNLAIASQSAIIAAGSSALVRSISNAR